MDVEIWWLSGKKAQFGSMCTIVFIATEANHWSEERIISEDFASIFETLLHPWDWRLV